MKKYLLLFISSILFSCANDDDNNNTTPEHDLNGSWEMTSYSAFSPSPVNIEEGEVVWNIDVAANKLVVENALSEEYPNMIASGTYAISIATETVSILSTTYTYSFEGEELIIANQPELDGEVRVFKAK